MSVSVKREEERLAQELVEGEINSVEYTPEIIAVIIVALLS